MTLKLNINFGENNNFKEGLPKEQIKPVVNVSVALAVDAFDFQLNVVLLIVSEATDRDFKCWKHSPGKMKFDIFCTVCPSAVC